jgi:hypothetical protein
MNEQGSLWQGILLIIFKGFFLNKLRRQTIRSAINEVQEKDGVSLLFFSISKGT